VNERIDKKTLVARVARRAGVDEDVAAGLVEATLEEIYEALKQCECVSLRNFGTFYIRKEGRCRVFRFNPSQRLRKLFGWSSSYKGKL